MLIKKVRKQVLKVNELLAECTALNIVHDESRHKAMLALNQCLEDINNSIRLYTKQGVSK